MAKEIKSVNVHPSEEESTINVWQAFGWEFKSTQEVKTSDSSHLEQRGDTIYNVTKSGVHYVKLTFERDPERQDYSELASLQTQYDNVIEPGPQPKWFNKILFIVFIVPLAAGLTGSFAAGYLITPVLFIIWSVIYFMRKKSWEKAADDCISQHAAILEKSKALS